MSKTVNKGTVLVIAGVVVAAALWVGLSPAPFVEKEEEVGTITPAVRYRAEVAPTAEEPAAAEGLSAEDLAAEGAGDSTADRSQAEEAAKTVNDADAVAVSDVRLKRDIRYLKTLGNGVRLYTFRYWNDDRLFSGVLAQDLLADERYRDAVQVSPEGYYRVNLEALGLRFTGDADQYREAGSRALAGAANENGEAA